MKRFNTSEDRFKRLNERYKTVSGEDLPLEMMSHETYETLEKYIKLCEKTGKDMLPEIYQWEDGLMY